MQPKESPTSTPLALVPAGGGSELKVDLPTGPPVLTADLARLVLRVLQSADRRTTCDDDVPGSSHTDAVAS